MTHVCRTWIHRHSPAVLCLLSTLTFAALPSCGSDDDGTTATAGGNAGKGGSSTAGSPGQGGLSAGGFSGSAGISGSGGSAGGVAQASPRDDRLIDDGWLFYQGDASDAEQSDFDDSGWTALDLPHTWNALDGQDGPSTPYYRGVGWYRKHLTVPADASGKKLYLQFDGANIISDVFVNGVSVGTHAGGFATFRFDVTSLLALGADNMIAVRVNNEPGVDSSNVIVSGSPTANVAPLSGDFTFFGGLYRSVHLLATDPLAIDPMDYGSPGVFIAQANVNAASAELAITVELSNANAEQRTASVTATLFDADGAEVQALTGTQAVTANGKASIELEGTLENPHLWNGKADPYLYTVRVDVKDGATLTDSLTQPLGLRSFSLDADEGFYLNGAYLDLHGVNKHQDHENKGWAIADSDTDADFDIIDELGATMVRLAHYQHAQHTYDVADERGYVIWAETPVVNRINDTPEFAANAEQQLVELIRQNYNHPSIVFWSVGNEVLLRTGPNPDALISHLSDVAGAEDPTRLVSYAANAGGDTNPVNWHGTAHGFNEYQGWYFATVADFATWADQIHDDHPGLCVGVTEYGAGASIAQHTANPAAADTGNDHTGGSHSEEYQAYYHEGYWTALKARPFLWGKLVWNGFDFASDGRTEGGSPGLNDKGLVSFDRATKKDSFFWYKANWSSEPFVYITSRRFDGFPAASSSAKVYSNQATVELKLNGTSLGTKSSEDHIFVWTAVPWVSGANVVEASAATNANVVTDQVTWNN